eukprot:3808612-Amphidinium_carterae.2
MLVLEDVCGFAMVHSWNLYARAHSCSIHRCSIYTGYWQTVKHLKELSPFPQYEFNALINLDNEGVLGFVCTASVASVLAEHMLLSVMRDNRVASGPMNSGTWLWTLSLTQKNYVEDHRNVESLPDFVMNMYGSLLNMSGGMVRLPQAHACVGNDGILHSALWHGHRAKLKEHDPHWERDFRFYEEVLGEGGSKRLQTELKQKCLSTPEKRTQSRSRCRR